MSKQIRRRPLFNPENYHRAVIELITSKGLEVLNLPVVRETTTHVVCKLSGLNSPAEEHFAFSSPKCRVLYFC